MLIDILNSISPLKGRLNLADERVKSIWVARINEAARGLYERSELLDSSRTAVFETSELATDVIAFPWYVMVPLRIRNIRTKEIFDFAQQAGRFQEFQTDFNNFTITKRSPLNREILNAGPLTFTLKDTESATFRISGRTNKSSSFVETLTITNALSGTTAAFWEDVESITQDVHTYDTTVTDIDDVVISRIPNNMTEVFYTHYRFKDDWWQNTNKQDTLELLYRPVYEPMLDDRSNFQCGSRYDDAIKYMTLSRDALESEKNPGLAQQYDAKAQAILAGLHANAQTGQRQVVFERNRFLTIGENGHHPQRLYWRY
jgi:hypothetical protein